MWRIKTHFASDFVIWCCSGCTVSVTDDCRYVFYTTKNLNPGEWAVEDGSSAFSNTFRGNKFQL
ncbi:hypothetical protein T265_03822 [Opisthorchis viverrini]|uniref:Uncharacterized protein n=1 Tax=Opisthorchis viverrini TaxID=6198 RepID=A0A075AHC1_OPIVI|nr:hypothetical protein T265_03822 [Opisthorchis viverrini]KER29624.1 hypothetical protein T265_03822 [Opisthorchis viverrini]